MKALPRSSNEGLMVDHLRAAVQDLNESQRMSRS